MRMQALMQKRIGQKTVQWKVLVLIFKSTQQVSAEQCSPWASQSGILLSLSLPKMNKTFLLNCWFIPDPAAKNTLRRRSSAADIPTARLPSLRSLFAVGTCYFAWGKTALLASCLSLSRGTAASSYHKKPPGASRLLFSFPHALIDLEYKVPIWASAQFTAAAKQALRKINKQKSENTIVPLIVAINCTDKKSRQNQRMLVFLNSSNCLLNVNLFFSVMWQMWCQILAPSYLKFQLRAFAYHSALRHSAAT